MKLVVDMNLSPSWVERLEAAGWKARHWSSLGDPRAPDVEVLRAVASQQAVLLTADLDFGAILAASAGRGPSVVQLRLQDLTPAAAGELVVEILRSREAELSAGALLSIEETEGRLRLLPLARP